MYRYFEFFELVWYNITHRGINTSITRVKRQDSNISMTDNWCAVVKLMVNEDIDIFSIIDCSSGTNQIVKVLGYQNIISNYKTKMEENLMNDPNIFLWKNRDILKKHAF